MSREALWVNSGNWFYGCGRCACRSILFPARLLQFFFFSSRRRHTILVSDWSSDVCSSDSSRRRHTRLVSDWSSDVCSSDRSEEHTSELQSLTNLVCRLLL